MDVGSSMNIYGNLFGWHLFDLIYAFLVGTGLILIPFMIMLYNAFMARDEGNRYDPVSALISIELKAYVAVAVLIIFLIPSVSANKLVFIYDDGAKIQKSGATGTTFDKFADGIPDQVNIPFGWYAVLYASSGFTKAIKKMLPTGEHARQIMYQLQQANMDDPKLQKELMEFERRCARPARARLNTIMNEYPHSKLAQKFEQIYKSVRKDVKDQFKVSQFFVGSKSWEIAPVYPGNRYFMDYLYNDEFHGSVRPCKIDINDTSKNEDPNTTLCIPPVVSLNPVEGGTCQNMWKGGFAGFGKGTVDKLQDYYQQAGYAVEDEDSFVYGQLTSANLNMREKGVGDLEGNGWQWLSEKLGALGLNIGSIFADFFNSVIRFYLPIVLGVITLLFVMLLPLLITFGRFQMGTVVSLGIMYFGIAFLPGIWHVAAWIDQVMLVAVYGGQGIIEGMFSMQKAVLDMVSLSVYTLFTWLWIGVLREMGGYAAHAIHSSMANSVNEAGTTHSKGSASAIKSGKTGARNTVNSIKNKSSSPS